MQEPPDSFILEEYMPREWFRMIEEEEGKISTLDG